MFILNICYVLPFFIKNVISIVIKALYHWFLKLLLPNLFILYVKF